MRLRALWLALLLLALLLPAPPAAADGLLPEVWLEVEFSDPRQATLELRVATGGGLAGEPLPGTGAQLARPAFGAPELDRVARALANDSGAFSAELLAGQLLFGHLRWQELAGSGEYQNSVEVREVWLYGNGFRVVLAVMLDPALPLELRPLYCLYDNPRLAGGEPAVSGYELTLVAHGSTTFSTNGVHFNHLRWLQPGATLARPSFGVTFSSRELYLDPTELLGVGDRYDAQTTVITVNEPALQDDARLLLALYALLCGGSWLLLRHNREYRLHFGIYRWLAVAALFPLAFLPLSGVLFIFAALSNTAWDAAWVAQARQRSRQRATHTGELEPLAEPAPPEDGADRQLTGEVVPHERELLDKLLDEPTPVTLDTLDPGQAPLLGEQREEVVLPDGGLRPLPTASCPHCDAPVEQGWQACPSCGGALGERAAAASPGPDDELPEAQPVSMDVLLSSLGDDKKAGDSASKEASDDKDGMDDLRKKLESLNED